MSFEKHNFKAGDKLTAQALNEMEDGIFEAIEAGPNLEKGTGKSAVQQLQDQDKDKTIEGNPEIPLGYFSFKGRNKYAAEIAKDLYEEDHDYRYLYDWHTATGTEEKDYVPYGAKGDYSISLGGKSLAKGKRSSASGTTTLALGNYSHAEGDVSVAMGNDSHVEGYETTTGPYATAAHAEGSQTIAFAEGSHAEGIWSIAANKGSHAGGIGTIATKEGQYAIGSYNEIDNSAMFVVGAGESDEKRKTIFKIDEDGSIYYLNNRDDKTVSYVSLQEKLSTVDHNIERHGAITRVLSSAHNWMMKYIFNVGGEIVSQITRERYPSGTKISFKYFIPEGTETKWWGLAWSTYSYNPDIYAAASSGTAHCLSTVTGKWTDVEFTLPEGGPYYLYFGSEVGHWKLNGDDAYAFIKDFAINDEIADFSCNTDEWIFEVRDDNAVKAVAQEDIAAAAANMEKGTGAGSTQQIPREDKVTIAEGEDVGHFDFTGHPEAGMSGRIQYGAVGNYSAVLNGRGAALNKHAFAINNSTIAKGEESFAQGYETVAEGNSSFAGGTRTYAKGAAAVTFGNKTVAKGDYSSAFGVHTVAEDNYQTVVGVANEIGDAAESLFEVGNGELDEDGNVVSRSTAFRVMREGKVKIKDIWAKDDDDVIALGFLNHKMNNEYLPTLEESILTTIGEAIDPYLVVTSEREDKTSIQMKGCVANDRGAVALGTSTYATGQHSVALGCGAESSAMCAIAIGMNSKSTGEASFSVGVNAIAGGAHSRAMGTNINAGYVYQTVIGKNNDNKEGTLFEIGNGVDIDHRSNVLEVYTGGLVVMGKKVQQLPRTDKVTQKEGETTLHFDFTGIEGNGLGTRIQYGAIGNYSVSLNGRSAALNKHATSIGNSTIAKGEESFAQGYETIAEGNSSFAGGSRTWAKAEAATALGIQTVAEGKASIALGSQSIAHGEASFAQGWGSKAVGNYSIALGQNAATGRSGIDGLCSCAIGYDTLALGNYSFAFGHSSEAMGTNSFAFGYRTRAIKNDQIVLGRCNIERHNNAIFMIGCGTDTVVDNAFEVYSDGDIGIKKGDKIYSLHKMLAAYFTDANLKYN